MQPMKLGTICVHRRVISLLTALCMAMSATAACRTDTVQIAPTHQRPSRSDDAHAPVRPSRSPTPALLAQPVVDPFAPWPEDWRVSELPRQRTNPLSASNPVSSTFSIGHPDAPGHAWTLTLAIVPHHGVKLPNLRRELLAHFESMPNTAVTASGIDLVRRADAAPHLFIAFEGSIPDQAGADARYSAVQVALVDIRTDQIYIITAAGPQIAGDVTMAVAAEAARRLALEQR